ncbi:hypothetical protein HK096_001353, partial [Nowakowskiella sp. JEL0078]
FPRNNDSLDLWDDIISARCTLVDHLQTMIKSQVNDINDIVTKTYFEPLAKKEKLCHMLAMTKAALKQGNLGMVSHALTRISSIKIEENVPELEYLFWKLEYKRIVSQIDPRQLQDGSSTITNLILVMHNSKGQRRIETFPLKWRSKFDCLQSRFYDTIVDILTQTGEVCLEVSEDLLSPEHRKGITRIAKNVGCEVPTNIEELSKLLVKGSFLHMKRAVTENEIKETQNKTKLRLAEHCDRVLRWEESGKACLLQNDDKVEYMKVVISNVLEGMCHNIQGSSELLPRLIQLLEMNNSLMKYFLEKVASVPNWMFIQWLPQLMAVLDKTIGLAVGPILLRVSEEFPNVVCFPFAISSEQYIYKDAIEPEKNRILVEQLKDILKSTGFGEFTKELSRLTEPQHVLKDWIERAEVKILKN